MSSLTNSLPRRCISSHVRHTLHSKTCKAIETTACNVWKFTDAVPRFDRTPWTMPTGFEVPIYCACVSLLWEYASPNASSPLFHSFLALAAEPRMRRDFMYSFSVALKKRELFQCRHESSENSGSPARGMQLDLLSLTAFRSRGTALNCNRVYAAPEHVNPARRVQFAKSEKTSMRVSCKLLALKHFGVKSSSL